MCAACTVRSESKRQANIVEYLFFALGEDAFSPSGRLESVLAEARIPQLPVGQSESTSTVKRPNQWRRTDTDALRAILVDPPNLYGIDLLY
jgi:hypothetical protein